MVLSTPLRYLAAVILSFTGPAWAGTIYTYTAPDGSVHLSNVPPDSRYTLLISDEGEKCPEPLLPLAPAAAPANKSRFDQLVSEVARGYGLESALLHAVISVESRYNPNAQSPKGAGGLMQLMPATAKRFGVADVFDPTQNLHGGAKYLRHLLRLFNSDVKLALAAYNAGENAVARYDGTIPPFRETMEYVPKVLDYYRKYRRPVTKGG